MGDEFERLLQRGLVQGFLAGQLIRLMAWQVSLKADDVPHSDCCDWQHTV
jgi:hypothetical protein